MEAHMRDLALQAAGALAILIAIAHGAIAELRIFPRAQIEPRGTRRLLRLIWQASTLDWIAIGVLLIAAPFLDAPAARHWIVAAAGLIYRYAAGGDSPATRPPHLRGVRMRWAVGLALVGAWRGPRRGRRGGACGAGIWNRMSFDMLLFFPGATHQWSVRANTATSPPNAC